MGNAPSSFFFLGFILKACFVHQPMRLCGASVYIEKFFRHHKTPASQRLTQLIVTAGKSIRKSCPLSFGNPEMSFSCPFLAWVDRWK